MENTIVRLSQKNSGNYIVAPFTRPEWLLIGEFLTPKELLNRVRELNNYATVIKSEYSQSKLKTFAGIYSIKDALKAFGIAATKSNIEKYS